MRKRMVMILFTAFYLINIRCMEKEQPKGPSFDTHSSLTLKYDNFEHLLRCNAVLLKRIAGQVPPHEKLFSVEKVLRAGLEGHNYNILHQLYGQEIVHYARLIAYRSDDCGELLAKIASYNTYGAEKIIERNPHLAHYFPFEVPYGQTLLHYVLDLCERRRRFESHDMSFPNRFTVIARALLKAGANPHIKDGEGNTCMHFASIPEHINLLLEYGGAIDVQNKKGNTPLMHMYVKGSATYSIHGNPLQQLLNGDANPDEQNEEGDTIFHEAVKKNDVSVCHMLLHYGASFMIPNKKDKTAVCDLPQRKKSLRKEIKPYMQQFLWNKIIESEWEIVKEFLQRYPWINLIVDGKHLVKWAEKRNPQLGLSFLLILDEIKSNDHEN